MDQETQEYLDYLDAQDELADEANLKAERRARGVEGFIGPSDDWVFSEGFWTNG
jgi:hypothetical protein